MRTNDTNATATRNRFCAILCTIMLLLSGLTSATPAGESVTLKLGTGEEGGLYLPIGRAIAELLSKATPPIALTVITTSGSTDNINGVLDNSLALGLAQSDKQFQAVEGRAEWNRKPQESLRFLCSLHPEAVTLVASESSSIKTVNDLKGKRVGIGRKGSGQNSNAHQTLSANGLDPANDLTVREISPQDCVKALQAGELDAFFFTAGHPNEIITAATSGKVRTRIIPINGEGVELLIEANPHLQACAIPAKKLYPSCANDDTDVATFGTVTTLVCNDKLPAETTERIVATLVENLQALQNQFSVLQKLTPAGMAHAGQTAPIHPGAASFFKKSEISTKE